MPGQRDADDRLALTPAQWSIYEAGWDTRARFRVAVCGRRFGKALSIDTELASPDGWSTMGAVQVGSRLFDDTGRVCKVTFTTGIMTGRPCNEVAFDDGSVIVADDEHRWQTQDDELERTLLLTTRQLAEGLQAGKTYSIASCHALRDRGFLGVFIRRRLLKSLLVRYGIKTEKNVWRINGDHKLLHKVFDLCVRLGFVPRYESHRESRCLYVRLDRSGRRRIILSIVAVRTQPVKCIQVDSPSRLFLCGRACIPTHNTFLMAEELRRAARLAVGGNVSTDNEIWYGAPTFIQAKRVMWSRLKRVIPRKWIAGKPNETTCSMRLLSGHTIRLVGLENADNLRGSGLWFFGGDEWADCHPAAWSEVIRPMLSTAGGHALFIGTPKGFDHFRDAYMLGQPGGDESYRSFLFTTADGGNVPDEELKAAAEQLDPRSYRQEYCASFETYAGRVVYAFSRSDNVYAFKFDPKRPVHVGMDFNVNPMSATIWQEDGPFLRQIGEVVMPTSNTDEMADEITRRYGRDGFGAGKGIVDHITIYPDPAGAQRRSSAGGRTDISILKEKGFTVCVPRAHPPVRDRLNITNRCFRSADGTITATVDPGCSKSIEAYERLVFKEGTNDPEKNTGFDHLVDATGYYLFSRSSTRASSTVSTFMER